MGGLGSKLGGGDSTTSSTASRMPVKDRPKGRLFLVLKETLPEQFELGLVFLIRDYCEHQWHFDESTPQPSIEDKTCLVNHHHYKITQLKRRATANSVTSHPGHLLLGPVVNEGIHMLQLRIDHCSDNFAVGLSSIASHGLRAGCFITDQGWVYSDMESTPKAKYHCDNITDGWEITIRWEYLRSSEESGSYSTKRTHEWRVDFSVTNPNNNNEESVTLSKCEEDLVVSDVRLNTDSEWICPAVRLGSTGDSVSIL